MGDAGAMIRLVDPLALLIVLGGSLLVAAIRSSRSELAGAFAALGPLLRADPEEDARAARRIVNRVEDVAEARGLACTDRAATTGRFLADALQRLAEARSADLYARWAEDAIDARRRRHAGIAGAWRAAADAAPAMGMVATVIGLIRMFARLDDPAGIGQPMAMALVATLLGLLLANLVAGPIADRLERLSEAELAWQRRALDHFITLARRELHQPTLRALRGIAA